MCGLVGGCGWVFTNKRRVGKSHLSKIHLVLVSGREVSTSLGHVPVAQVCQVLIHRKEKT